MVDVDAGVHIYTATALERNRVAIIVVGIYDAL